MPYRRLILTLTAVALGTALLLEFFARRQPDPAEQFREALAALDRSDFGTVARTISSLERRPAFVGHVHLLRGGLLVRRGEPAAALEELTARRPEGEIRAPGLLFFCEALHQLGHLAAAEDVARQLIEEQPENADAHRWLAAIYYDLAANNAAIAELGIVVTLRPEDYRPRHLLGVIYFDFEKFSEAARHYRKALDLNPPPATRAAIVQHLVRAMVRSREYEAALQVLEDESGFPLDDPWLLALASECHWALGRRDEAQRLLEMAQERNPDERAVLLLKARVQMETGDPEAAIAPLVRHLDHDRHDFECRYRLALSYQRLGRSKDYERESARMLASQQLRKELSESSDQAVEEPRNAEVRDRIAEICDRLDKPELAEIYRQAARECRRTARGPLPQTPP